MSTPFITLDELQIALEERDRLKIASTNYWLEDFKKMVLQDIRTGKSAFRMDLDIARIDLDTVLYRLQTVPYFTDVEAVSSKGGKIVTAKLALSRIR